MKRPGSRLGGRVRALRRREGLTQASLADRLGISASYLNLIEHDRRPLTAPILIRMAQLFAVEIHEFSQDEDARLAADLLEVFGDPLFDSFDLIGGDVRELASAAPGAARAVVALYRAYQSARLAADTLSAGFAETPEARGLPAVVLPSEEVSDVLQRQLNHFPELEAEAEGLREAAGGAPTGDLVGRLAAYLRATHDVRVAVLGAEAMAGAVRRYEPESRTIALAETLRPEARAFQLAHVAALVQCGEALDRVVGAQHLGSPDSRALCRVALANYLAAAVLMPYEPFLAAATAERYDIELLAHRFGASFEQVCHRLTTLQRPGAQGVPFHLVRIDIAGNISKRFSASGIRFARFSASCPLWNVHAAFHTPGRIRVQLSRMPSGATYLCMARTLHRGGGRWRAPAALQALAIGCEVGHARQLVYGDGLDLDDLDSAVKVGVTCRLCERTDCEQRAMPPLHEPLRVDENVRGISFYAPVR